MTNETTITLAGKVLEVRFGYSPRKIGAIKRLAPGTRKWDGAEKVWIVDALCFEELLELLPDASVSAETWEHVYPSMGERIPDVLAQSGARLVEVGTTNRTRARDYERAITPDTVAILIVHHSNYKIIGFSEEPETAELAALARDYGLMLLHDQGSGALIDTAAWGLAPEPTVIDGLRAGCDVVAFSGDKLLGGPQAGILAGRADLIARAKRHPLARAVRADKLALAALSATLTHYLTGHTDAIPVWRMIARPLDEIAAEAESWAAQLRGRGIMATTAADESFVGGGSLPGESLPTRVVVVDPGAMSAGELAARLRAAPTPVIGRIHDGRLRLDPRTVLPGQAEGLLRTVERVFSEQ